MLIVMMKSSGGHISSGSRTAANKSEYQQWYISTGSKTASDGSLEPL
jgi:hypothetical protein